jgi:hypothetical protein
VDVQTQIRCFGEIDGFSISNLYRAISVVYEAEQALGSARGVE